MPHETLKSLVRTKRWDDVEVEWLAVIEQPTADPAVLLKVVDDLVSEQQTELAETMGWAWLSSMKEKFSAREALRLGRGLLLRLPDGEQLREEILALYKETHTDHPQVDTWIERSGLKSGKSVRRALRFLDVGLRLAEGTYLIHSTEDEAAQVVETDFDDDEITIRKSRRTQTLSLAEVVGDYDIASENDFLVMQQLHPERIGELIEKDPIALFTGILSGHRREIDRDELKLMLVPAYLPPKKWADWWGRIRTGVKKSTNLRLEGRSPMFLIYDPVGQTLEQETWTTFAAAQTPRQWLDVLEGYLRDGKLRKKEPDTAFLDRIQTALVERMERFRKHREPEDAFATALVIERLAADGLPVATGAHGSAIEMLRATEKPVEIVAGVPDARLWSLGVTCIEQAFPEEWPDLFAQLILFAPAGQCNVLAKRVETAGKGDRLVATVDQAVAEPGRFTDAMMWVWNGPAVSVELPIPPATELLASILALVGPARLSEGRAVGQTVNRMRIRVRAGLGAKGYAAFKKSYEGIDLPLAQTIRRLIQRAEGLGPSAQGDMLTILTRAFPDLYVKVELPVWEDPNTLYFSRQGLRKREDELDELVNVKMRENAKAIGEAAAHGDLSENSEYKFALEERDLLRARVAQINSELALAKLLEPDEIPTDHVSIGQELCLRPTGGGEPRVLRIMGAGDSDITTNVYSYKTPLAQQMMGVKKGATVQIAFDGKDEIEYEIAEIESVMD